MTGAEIPVAKAIAAAGAVVGKVVAEDADERKALAAMAKDSPAMVAASEAYARRVAVKQALLLKLYQPLAKLAGISREYFASDFGGDMAAKLANVREEDLTTPRASVVVPVMQGLGYSLDEPSLKDLYLNLLASASSQPTADLAHPAFADVIKQLSPDEARLLTQVLATSSHTIVQISRSRVGQVGSNVVLEHLLQIENGEIATQLSNRSVRVWVENWVRLGLIRVAYDEHFTREGAYDWAEARGEFLAFTAIAEEGQTYECDQGTLRRAPFGERFAEAVGCRNDDKVDVLRGDA